MIGLKNAARILVILMVVQLRTLGLNYEILTGYV
jgi:hypothetical protein